MHLDIESKQYVNFSKRQVDSMNMMKYKGYVVRIELDEEARVYSRPFSPY